MSQITVPSAVQALIDAINAADLEAFVACFAADAMISHYGQAVSGPDRVRQWAQSGAIGASARMRLVEAGTTDGITHLVFDWSSRMSKGRSEAFVTVRDGLVVEFRIPPQ
jgi:SnoaL-like domain